jgi:hypothetical protein
MKTYRLSFVLDGYNIQTREISARSLASAKNKLRRMCPRRKITSIKPW